MKKNLLLVFAVFIVAHSYAQKEAAKWKAAIETRKVFIENKGQFDLLTNDAGGKVLYGTDGNRNVILFTPNGLAYRMEMPQRNNEDLSERLSGNAENDEAVKENYEKEQEDIEQGKLKSEAIVKMQWVGANANVEIVAEGQASDYFNYHLANSSVSGARGYSKITYKNLYNNIDVVYTFHADSGIEYTLLVHPGGDVSQVKMHYSGDDNISLNGDGNLHINTVFGDIIDRKPIAYAGNIATTGNPNNVGSSQSNSCFKLDENEVTFKLGDYDHTQTLIIDPWTTTPTLPRSGRAFYIKTDSVGNAYVYGGDTPFSLEKYNSAGTLQWTYNTGWDSSSYWFGALIVDREGNSYITNGTGATLAKVNTAGSLVWSNSYGSLGLAEFWTMDFNCDQSQLVIGGMKNLTGYIYNMSLTNGAVLTSKQVATTYEDTTIIPIINTPLVSSFPDEIRALTFSPNGNFYFFTPNTFGSITSPFVLNYEIYSGENLPYYLPYSEGGTGQGQNSIRASLDYVYTTNGEVLQRRNLGTGAIIDSVKIPGGVYQMNSGVAIDTCGNVYVGSQNAVIKYTYDLTYVSTATTSNAVYDVSIGTNGDVMACGEGFAGAYAMSACPQILPICYKVFAANLTPAPPSCYGKCTGSASAATTNGTGPYKYAWSNSATTATINNLCPGTYFVTVTDLSDNTTAVASTTVDSGAAFIAHVVTFSPACGQTNGKVQAEVITGGSSPFTYAWSGGASQQVDSNLAPGPYSVTVTDAHGCSATAGATLNPSSSLTLTPVATSAACSSNTGTASIVVSGAPGPYQYSWSNGQTTDTITGLAAGTYTVTVQDTASTGSVFWSEYFTTGGTNWTLNDTGTVLTNGADANQWIINNDATCNCTTGNYLHITCNPAGLECAGQGGTCTYVATPTIIGNCTTDVLAVSPAISTVGKSNIKLGFTWLSLGTPGSDYGLVDLSADGGLTWTKLPTKYDNTTNCTYTSISIPSGYENISNFKIAFEWINAPGSFTGAGANPPGFAIDSITLSASTVSCPATSSVIVGSSTNLTIAPAATGATCGFNNGTAAANVSGGSGYSYLWSNGATTDTIKNLAGGTYTVTVTGTGGCSVTASTVVGATGSISLSPVTTATSCNSNNGAVVAGVSSGSGPFTYLWTNGATTSQISGLAWGTYSVTVTGLGGCIAKATVFVDSSSIITLTTTGGSSACASGGTASVTVNTGTGPFTYLWSNGATTASLTGLLAGTYKVTVTGAGNCPAVDSAVVTDIGGSITLTAASRATSCSSNIGAVVVTVTAGTGPYTYNWSTGATTSGISNLALGNYTVTVTGAGGCTATASANVSVSGVFLINATATGTTCGNANGTAYVTATGGPFTYSWSNGATTDTITHLASGTYTVTVYGLSGCNATQEVTVNPSGGTVTIQASADNICQGDTSHICAPAGYQSYQWNVGGTSDCLNATAAGNYYVTVTDNANCTAVSNHITIAVNTPPTVTLTLHGNDTLVASGATSYQWYFGSTVIAGVTGSIYVGQQNGTYSVVGTDGNGCTGKSNPEVIKTILGIDQVSGTENIKIYPNPLQSGNWHVDVSDEWIGSACDIIDEAGRVVYHTQLKGSQSEIELNIAQGVYLMRINSGQKNYTVKLIKL